MSLRSSGRYIIGGAIAPFLLALVLTAGCGEESQQAPSLPPEESDLSASQLSRNLIVTFMDSSRTKAKLYARRGRMYQDRMETYLDTNVVVDFMNEAGDKRLARLTADSAKIDDKTRNMTAMGNVRVVSDSTGKNLQTTLLIWNNTTQKLTSTEYVKITSPEETVEGIGFESDQFLKHYVIYKVSGTQQQ